MLWKGIILFLAAIGLYWLFGITCFSDNRYVEKLRDYAGVERQCVFVKENRL